MLRRRREAAGGARASRRGGATAATGGEERIGTRFKMNQRFFTIGDRYFIENERGDRVFRVESKILRLRTTLKFQDMDGNDIYKVQEKVARVRDTMEIEHDGHAVAKVHNALITPLRDRWKISVSGDEDLTAKGNILNHEYKIFRGDQVVGAVSKKWFRVRDMYGVDVRDNQDALLILAITVVIDIMAHEGR
ncbi:LURP-one-related family protein [Methanolobus sp. ZRKC2]|uniref:LURP-one-related/scramblase family protein n=1 Tax=Methanolobus sp. ZRKC2 TaxID=3125783 RepID=UPI00324ED917